MKISALVLVFALAAGAAQAQSVGAANTADVRCLIGMGVLGRNEQYKQASVVGSFYFAGRIEGRNPDFDLKRAVRMETPRIGVTEYADIIRRCTDEIGVKGRALTELGERPPSRGVGR